MRATSRGRSNRSSVFGVRKRARFRGSFAYEGIPGLSREMVERLTSVRPETLAQAQRVPGVTPAAVALIASHLGGR